MCTSLIYRDAAGRPYFGRTLELTVELPYQVAYVPPGTPFSSASAGHPALGYRACHAFVAVTVPDRVPAADAPVAFADLKVLEGLNDQGLTFSLLSYPAASGKQKAVDLTRAVLSASDLGSWALGQFATVAEVKTALAEQPVMLEALAMLGGVESPFHYVVHDATGAALVIEFDHGAMTLHDNPVGVMTNGPAFGWHLTNLDNYTFLSNVDRSRATFGTYTATQPDSGIATAGLPASNTSVGRFVRAAYYAQFTEAAATPDLAVTTLAHIMNTFDRPRGVTIDTPDAGGGHMEVAGLAADTATPYATEFTSWTNLSDLARRQFFLRSYQSLAYTAFDLAALAGLTTPRVVALAHLDGANGTALLTNAPH
ncbi:linear amide C-N hydrolase [Acuticoccus sp. I52.16.1]|uniref:linear amide C-N hydrolase n=1 Tax=Acuticoccus sp. I52.16.1 TaxID=2928472 RepID=UPI001FD47405|nr:linear amide C-N hydrolase [Acuticoccus sp. I52.16.1]UOM32566.1 linear amide C-N hydrolase [Acuticoccus sp. I52.16.1]